MGTNHDVAESRGRIVTEFVKALGVPRSTVPRHVTILLAAQLIKTERHGVSIAYWLADAHFSVLLIQVFSCAQHERLWPPDRSGEVLP